MIDETIMRRVRELGLTTLAPRDPERAHDEERALYPRPDWEQGPFRPIDGESDDDGWSPWPDAWRMPRVIDPALGQQPPDWDRIREAYPPEADDWVPRPGEEEWERDPEGIDRFAWYRPFHFEPQDAWGIYIRDWGVYEVARRAFQPIKKPARGWPTLQEMLDAAYEVLRLHEGFHHVVEVAATAIELTRAEVAQPSSMPIASYVPYNRDVYQRPQGWAEPLEEALANAYAFNRFRPRRATLRAFMKRQPAGYRAFELYEGETTCFRIGLGELSALLRDPTRGKPPELPFETIFDLAPIDDVLEGVPIRPVNSMQHTPYGLSFIAAFPRDKQRVTRKFQRDLRDHPEWARPVEAARNKLEKGLHGSGLRFKKLGRSLYCARVSREIRLLMSLEAGGVIALERVLGHQEYERAYKRGS